MQPNHSSPPIVLKIQGLGHVPSKKNHHYPLTNGGVGLDKEIRQWMRRAQTSIESQLLSLWQTSEPGMEMECIRPVLISLLTRSPKFDDNWKVIPKHEVSCVPCLKGMQGATITIERIT